MDTPQVAPLPTGRAPGQALRAYHLLFGNYWAITRPAYLSMLEIASRARFSVPELAALQERTGLKLTNARVTTVRDGVAVIPVQGPIFPHASGLDALSGAVGTEELGQDVRVALDDPNVHAIMLDVASPGGAVEGTAAFARQLREAGATKPVWAYVSGDCASAAYWIASAASRLVVDETALVGNIGVIAAVPDPAAPPAAGERPRVQFVSSQSPNKRPDPHSAAGKDIIQTSVDHLAQVFIDAVARNRGMTAEQVMEAGNHGDVLVGQHAVDAGLADAVGSFEATLADLVSEVGTGGTSGTLTARSTTGTRASLGTVHADLQVAAGRDLQLAIVRDAVATPPGERGAFARLAVAAATIAAHQHDPVLTAETAAPDVPVAPTPEGGNPMPDEISEQTAARPTVTTATTEADRIAALEAALADAQGSNADLRAAVDRLSANAQRDRAVAEVTGRHNAGVPWRGETEAATALYIRMENAMGADSEDFQAFVEQQRFTATSLYNSGAFHEAGHDNPTAATTARQQLEALAEPIRLEALAGGTTMSKEEAFVEAMRAHADLKAQFQAEARQDRLKRGGRS